MKDGEIVSFVGQQINVLTGDEPTS